MKHTEKRISGGIRHTITIDVLDKPTPEDEMLLCIGIENAQQMVEAIAMSGKEADTTTPKKLRAVKAKDLKARTIYWRSFFHEFPDHLEPCWYDEVGKTSGGKVWRRQAGCTVCSHDPDEPGWFIEQK